MILRVAMLTVLLMMVPMVLLVMTTAMQDSEHNVMRHRSQRISGVAARWQRKVCRRMTAMAERTRKCDSDGSGVMKILREKMTRTMTEMCWR